MSKRHTSTNSERHPYCRADKVHYFWHKTEGRIFGYSQQTKDELDRQANAFILANSNAKKTNWQTVSQEWLDTYTDEARKKKLKDNS